MFPLHSLQHLNGRHQTLHRLLLPPHVAVWDHLAAGGDAQAVDDDGGPDISSHGGRAGHERWAGLAGLALTHIIADIMLRGWGVSQSTSIWYGMSISSAWIVAFLTVSWMLVKKKMN